MKKSILVCDDNPAMLHLYKSVLEWENYTVITCQRAESVFVSIADTPPDIIILDISMMGLGGEKAIEMLKNDERYKAIPVIISSARPDIEEIAKRVKADAFLSKAGSNDELVRMVDSFLKK